jgi:gamma-glutamylcyclotransferase (GGCT)/AIG2-like uncharacterized protein YtfP
VGSHNLVILTVESPLHVFVYGTLKPGEANFDRYCGNRVISRHRAYIHAELYDFPALGYPGAIHGTSRVHGYVLTFANAEVLIDLDELEDYHPDRLPAENDYTRELVVAYPLEGHVLLSAWAYLMTPTRIQQAGGILVPDGWWESQPKVILPADRSVGYTGGEHY